MLYFENLHILLEAVILNVTKRPFNVNKEFSGTRQPVKCHIAQNMKIIEFSDLLQLQDFWNLVFLFTH